MKRITYKALLLAGLVLAAALVINPSADASESRANKFSSYDELNNFIKTSTQAYSSGVFMRTSVQSTFMEQAADGSTAKSAQPAASSYSATNIQVAGVDEADIVKTDGKYIYAVSGNKIIIADAYPAENAAIVSSVGIDGNPQEMFVNKDRLIVFGNENRFYAMKTGVMEEKMIAMPEIYPGPRYSPSTFIHVYDISDRSKPVLARNISVNGNYFDSRMIGDYVYAIINEPVYATDFVPLPVIRAGGKEMPMRATDIYYFNYPDSSYVYTNVLAINSQDDGQEISSKTFLTGYSQNMYVSTGNIYAVYEKRLNEIDVYGKIIEQAVIPNVPFAVQNEITVIMNSNISSYEKLQETGEVLTKYLDSLNPQEAAAVMKKAESDMASVMNAIMKEIEKTVVHKISIGSGKIEYVANGEVPGHVLNQFSMDEHNGYFRIATTTNTFWGGGFATRTMSAQVQISEARTAEMQIEPATTGQSLGINSSTTKVPVEKPSMSQPDTGIVEGPASPARLTTPAVTQPATQNHVYVLDSSLKITGKIEDMAPGERIYSVRFLGDKAYMVTFRQIDPLFVIDLSNPAEPKVLGFLKIPGVSDYLHPYDETHLIGIGRDATERGMMQGMKLSLFDVTDVSNPTEVSKYIIGERGTDSDVLRDHKAFLFSKEKNLLVLPISLVEGGRYNAFQGAFVFNVDLTDGFALKGKVTHVADQEKLKPAKEEPVGAERKDHSGYVWKKFAEDKWVTEVPDYAGIAYNDYNIDTFPGGINYYDYNYNSQIRRSLYIGDVLYTVSDSMIKMNNLGTLDEISKVQISNPQLGFEETGVRIA